MIIIGCDYHPGSNRLRLSIRTLVASTLNILESAIKLNLLLIATNPRDRLDSRYSQILIVVVSTCAAPQQSRSKDCAALPPRRRFRCVARDRGRERTGKSDWRANFLPPPWLARIFAVRLRPGQRKTTGHPAR